uniref:Uncharacterized protein n=1 Tax=Anguilla anguilla TaxID=7936 RepID=A0A0E9WTW6_ANGAN
MKLPCQLFSCIFDILLQKHKNRHKTFNFKYTQLK